MALLGLTFALGSVARPRPEVRRDDQLDREARRIRRKYRKRMARARPGGNGLPGLEVVVVASMEDLGRISEELLKLIIYSGPSDPEGQHVFYIVDGATRYEHRLTGEG